LGGTLSGVKLYSSIDYGQSWIENTTLPSLSNFTGLDCSTDGNLVLVSPGENYIYISYNSGISWRKKIVLNSINLDSIKCSGDGSKIIAKDTNNEDPNNGLLYKTTSNFFKVTNSERSGVKVSTLTSGLSGINKFTNNFNWVFQNEAESSPILLKSQKKYETTGDWKITSDENGYSTIIAKRII
jgi:hypothetical protein